MKVENSSAKKSLSLERKIQMHEAREGIIDRLAQDLPEAIDLDRFLNAVVSEIGRMMQVDRCDVIQLDAQGTLSISHEWRVSPAVPSSAGVHLPLDTERLAAHFDLSKPLRINDTTALDIDYKARLFAASVKTRSLLVVPIRLGERVLGLLGLHDTKKPRVWLDDEVSFLQSIAHHLAVGYQYTTTFIEKQREAARTNALLEIANTLNSHSDFREVSSLFLEKAIKIVGAEYGALGVVDQKGEKISLAALRSAPHTAIDSVQNLVDSHGASLDLSAFPKLVELLREGKSLQVLDTQMPAPIRLIFNAKLGGRAAIVAPVKVGGLSYGLLGFVFSTAHDAGFDEHEIALVEGIADQIGTALERDQLSAEILRLKNELSQRQNESRIIGQTPPIRRVIELALSVADTPTTVLVQGESGTGKELLANLIHQNSGREKLPYIKINCGAIPETLLESELFGHEKGAFTDARSRRLGRFEEADGGTLFLDEIGEMSLSAQVKLLRVLQDGKFTRVGGSETIETDVRVIAASNVNLEESVAEGKFRRDLFYRLSAFPITIPPLRERRDDVYLLVYYFLEFYKQKTNRYVSGISREALNALINYEYPGNIRELENAVERAVIIASGRQIEIGDLPSAISGKAFDAAAHTRQERARAAAEGRAVNLEIQFPTTVDEIEEKAINLALDYTKGDKTRAARLLGIGRKTLYRKLEKYENNENQESR